ncbi:universal stress protein [Synechococcus sp. PCC 7336]|uniref:universal stress protein n=1 Tax=Synechococcus sp. PCC 7336 TaxID=195250 RepID=UPI00034650D7|nr:universal stress protein [Synechococcus sp. PCC 7336]
MNAIVVAVDVSPQAMPVVEALKTLNLAPHTRVVLAYVLPAAGEDDLPADVPNQARSPQQKLMQAETFLHELRDEVTTLLGEVKLAIEIATGDPAEEIVRLAGIHQADLIVLGSRGLKGVNRVILGSVSTQVVESAHCSVYVIKRDRLP